MWNEKCTYYKDCREEWPLLGWLLRRDKTESHFPQISPAPVWWAKTPFESNSCWHARQHIFSLLRGKPAASRLENACQGLLLPSFSLLCWLLAHILLLVASLPPFSAQLKALLSSIPCPSPSFLACCPTATPLPPFGSLHPFGTETLCHNDLFFWFHLLWVLPASTNAQGLLSGACVTPGLVSSLVSLWFRCNNCDQS